MRYRSAFLQARFSLFDWMVSFTTDANPGCSYVLLTLRYHTTQYLNVCTFVYCSSDSAIGSPDFSSNTSGGAGYHTQELDDSAIDRGMDMLGPVGK